MATHEISVLGAGTGPDTSGEVYQQPYSLDDTGATADPFVWVFAAGSTKIGLHFSFVVPQNYVGTEKINVYWNSSATAANDIELDCDMIAVAAGEDAGGSVTALTGVASTDSATAYILRKGTISAGFPTLAVGDLVLGSIYRDQADAGDTVTVDVNFFDVTFEYDDA